VGGHSGSSIHLSTVNTIVEIFNILKTVTQKYQFNIVDVKSTTQLNAIPPHCDVVINIKRNQVNHFRKMMLTQFNYLLEAHQQNDKNISLVIDNVRAIADPLITQDTNKLINLVCAANNGLNAYNITYNVPNVSTNLGKLTLTTNEAQFA
jgi:hypothetical protein